MIKNNSDILFLFDAINTNPNGDPDQENKPRMDYETKTLLVSDIRRKRDVRDFLSNKGYAIFVNTLNDTKVTMDKMLESVLDKYNLDKDSSNEEKVNIILDNMIDIRMFGSAMAVGGITKTFTGPIQMTWGYSLNPVDIIKSSSIVTIMNDDNSTFGKMYKAHYALVAHSGTVNKFAAAKTRLTENDKNLFSKALVQSMMNNLTHSKQGQQPLLYLEIIYSENFDGYLGDIRRFIKSEIHKENAIRSINDIAVNFEDLTSVINDMKTKGYIKDVIIWTSQLAKGFKNLPEARMVDLLLPIK
mgnify:CR=1 FL=1|jgi:CRISPR-associated protein Csh2